MLAGIYTHTSGHIVAAAMAHYMAKNMSRFLYAHSSCWLPVHGIAKLINDETMVIAFRNIGNSQKCYAYRPKKWRTYVSTSITIRLSSLTRNSNKRRSRIFQIHGKSPLCRKRCCCLLIQNVCTSVSLELDWLYKSICYIYGSPSFNCQP